MRPAGTVDGLRYEFGVNCFTSGDKPSGILGTAGTSKAPVAITTARAAMTLPSSRCATNRDAARSSETTAPPTDRELEALGVSLELRRHLVTGGIPLGSAVERQPWELLWERGVKRVNES